jgi:hypothetical protein
MRKIVFWLHLGAGVTTGVVVVWMSFTGVLLAYEKQLTAWFDRGAFRSSGSNGDAARGTPAAACQAQYERRAARRSTRAGGTHRTGVSRREHGPRPGKAYVGGAPGFSEDYGLASLSRSGWAGPRNGEVGDRRVQPRVFRDGALRRLSLDSAEVVLAALAAGPVVSRRTLGQGSRFHWHTRSASVFRAARCRCSRAT